MIVFSPCGHFAVGKQNMLSKLNMNVYSIVNRELGLIGDVFLCYPASCCTGAMREGGCPSYDS